MCRPCVTSSHTRIEPAEGICTYFGISSTITAHDAPRCSFVIMCDGSRLGQVNSFRMLAKSRFAAILVKQANSALPCVSTRPPARVRVFRVHVGEAITSVSESFRLFALLYKGEAEIIEAVVTFHPRDISTRSIST